MVMFLLGLGTGFGIASIFWTWLHNSEHRAWVRIVNEQHAYIRSLIEIWQRQLN